MYPELFHPVRGDMLIHFMAYLKLPFAENEINSQFLFSVPRAKVYSAHHTKHKKSKYKNEIKFYSLHKLMFFLADETKCFGTQVCLSAPPNVCKASKAVP